MYDQQNFNCPESALVALERWCMIGEQQVYFLASNRGMGNTFYLRMLKQFMQDKRTSLPEDEAKNYPVAVYFDCALVSPLQKNSFWNHVIQTLNEVLHNNDPKKTEKDITEFISDGRLILLIDHADRFLDSQAITNFLAKVGKGRIIFSATKPFLGFKQATGLLEMPRDQYMTASLNLDDLKVKISQMVKRSGMQEKDARTLLTFCENNGLGEITGISNMLVILGKHHASLLENLTVENIIDLLVREIFLQTNREWSDVFGMPLMGLQARTLYFLQDHIIRFTEIDAFVQFICKEYGIAPTLDDCAKLAKLILLHPFITLISSNELGLLKGLDHLGGADSILRKVLLNS